MKAPVYSRWFIVFAVALLVACKHKQVEVVAVNKGKAKAPPAGKKPPAKPAAPEIPDDNPLSQKLGLNGKQIRDSRLYSFINEWYGTPYKYGGCQKSGVDCSCFTSLLAESVYHAKLARSAGEMYTACEKIGPEDAKEGDLCFFKINSSQVSHVGVYLKNKLFVHSSTSRGVIINSLDEAYYKKYFFCAGRIKNPS